MILVLDASAATTVALGLPHAPTFLQAIRAAERVIAPDIFVAEVTNALWKIAVFRKEEPETCARALQRALRLPGELVACTGLADEVLATARQARHPAYDLFYLVLARRQAATLASLDRKLLTMARRMKVSAIGA
jgi:predicted nucleic acid-binding protein